MAAGTPERPRAGEAARAHALAALRKAILSGDFAPGQRLVEEELAATLGVTRQSLRAALLGEGGAERDRRGSDPAPRARREPQARGRRRQPLQVFRAQQGTAPAGRR